MDTHEVNSIVNSQCILKLICSVVNSTLQKTLYDPYIPLTLRDKNSLYLKHKIDILQLLDIIEKEKKNVKKPKKLKIKNKPKTLRIVNYKNPEDFENEYDYFIHIVQQLNLNYFKYRSSCFWEGPSIILDLENYSKVKVNNIKKKFKIDLNYDILNFNQIAIYPKKKLREYDTI